jgi:hypothetical protein
MQCVVAPTNSCPFATEAIRSLPQHSISQYSSLQGATYVFMDMESYEEVRLPREESWAKFLKEGTECDLVFYNGAVLSVDPPMTMALKITSTAPGVKGDRSSAGTKPATLETGAEIQVCRHGN